MMKNKNPTMRELYELVKTFDDKIELPNSIYFNRISKFSTHIDRIKKEVKEYNKFSNDPKQSLKSLKLITRSLIHFLDEFYEDRMQINHTHALQLKKKDYVIKGLKDFIDSKDELDDEIPSDDEGDSKDDSKGDEEIPKGLSRRELSLIKKFQ